MGFDFLNSGLRVQRGQTSVEFLLVLVVALAYLLAIVMPNADLATGSLKDVGAISVLKVSADRLVGAIMYVSVSGEGSRQTVRFVVPQNGSVSCVDRGIQLVYTLLVQENVQPCADDADGFDEVCTRIVPVDASFSCNFEGGAAGLDVPGAYSALVVKGSSGVSVDFRGV